MPSLKDIRIRIASVKTTRQVTSAMKMVSAAKFKKSHDQIVAFRPFISKLQTILINLIGSMEEGFSSPYSEIRSDERILFVVISSNRGLCGAFNSNVVKLTERTIQGSFAKQRQQGKVDILAIGKQGAKLLRSHGFKVNDENNDIYTHVNYASIVEVIQQVMDKFIQKEYDKVVLVYNRFVNAATQEAMVKQFLPIELPSAMPSQLNHDYIFEPDKYAIVDGVVPKALKTSFYSCMLESIASEHGARMTSMHKATDNATALLNDLQLAYNKARQTAITNEILEIVGGAEALSK
jgi:F-type H+-transporting ATPase subunit gamma